jgi:hypothetical protein
MMLRGGLSLSPGRIDFCIPAYRDLRLHASLSIADPPVSSGRQRAVYGFPGFLALPLPGFSLSPDHGVRPDGEHLRPTGLASARESSSRSSKKFVSGASRSVAPPMVWVACE